MYMDGRQRLPDKSSRVGIDAPPGFHLQLGVEEEQTSALFLVLYLFFFLIRAYFVTSLPPPALACCLTAEKLLF